MQTPTPPPGLTSTDLLLCIRRQETDLLESIWLFGAVEAGPIPFDPGAVPENATDGHGPAQLAPLMQRHGGASCPGFGALLWAILPDELHRHLQRWLDRAPLMPRPRLVLWIDDNCVSCFLPWEALQLGAHEFPQHSRRIAIVRYVPGTLRRPDSIALERGEPLQLLVLIGDQRQLWRHDGAEASVEEAMAGVAGALRRLGSRCVVSLAAPAPLASEIPGVEALADLDAVVERLRRGDFHVLLYLGHSSIRDPVDPLVHLQAVEPSQRGLHFCFDTAPDAPPELLPVRGDPAGRDLVSALAEAKVRLVVLGACLVQDHLARPLLEVVDHLVTMGARITPALAAAFCGPFYRELAGRRPVSAGMMRARRRLARPGPHAVDAWAPMQWARDLDDAPLRAGEDKELFDYLGRVVRECAELRMPLAEGIDARRVLAKVYVELDLSPDRAVDGDGAPESDAAREPLWPLRTGHRGRHVEAFLADPTLEAQVRLGPSDDPWFSRRYAVLGAASDGKSTVLRSVARALAEESPFWLVPLYAEIQRLLDADVADLEGLWRFLGVPEDRAKELNQHGRLVLLLDSFDEAEDRDAATELLARLEQDAGNSVLVVASRPEGWPGFSPAAADAARRQARAMRGVTVQGLTPDSRKRLILNWCNVLWESCGEFPGLAAQATAQDAAAAVERIIGQSLMLERVTRNPLSTALVVRLFADSEQPEIPRRRHELYELFLGYLLEARHRERTLDEKAQGMGLTGLRRLALAMLRAGKTELRRPPESQRYSPNKRPDEVAEQFAALGDDVLRCAGAPWHDGPSFFEYVQKTAGLFVQKAHRVFGFVQKTFQDAFAARGLVEEVYRSQGLVALFEQVRGHLEETPAADAWRVSRAAVGRWAEALALVSGQLSATDREPWLRELAGLDRGLAVRALVEAGPLDPEVFWDVVCGADAESREEAIRALPAQLEQGDEALLLQVLQAGVDHTTDGDLLWVLDEVLGKHSWKSDALARRARAAVDERLLAMGRPAPELYRFVRIPTPKEHYGDRDWFWMGSPEDEEGRHDNEFRHQVVLTRPFWMATTTVTVEQFRQFDPSHRTAGEDGRLPARWVSYRAARIFCRWLELHRGRDPEAWRRCGLEDVTGSFGFRLPTEAQWEWAARAGTEGPYSLQEGQTLEDVAVYGRSWEAGPAPVASKTVNGFGLFDMHGNVWEWCLEVYAKYPKEQVVDPIVADGGACVLRGGSYGDGARSCRSAYRDWGLPAGAFDDGGFRVVLSAPERG